MGNGPSFLRDTVCNHSNINAAEWSLSIRNLFFLFVWLIDVRENQRYFIYQNVLGLARNNHIGLVITKSKRPENNKEGCLTSILNKSFAGDIGLSAKIEKKYIYRMKKYLLEKRVRSSF